MTLNQLLTDELEAFGERITQYLVDLGLQDQTKHLFADHLGIRLKNIDHILSLRHKLSSHGNIISSAIVNGREILIYKLVTPIRLHNWTIPCIELPYPKPDHSYPDGWEHIELVIPSSATTLDVLRNDFLNCFPEIDIDTLKLQGEYFEDEPHSETKQLPNPTITLRKNKNTSIKFHARTIEDVVS